MGDKKSIVYHLWAMPTNEKNIERSIKERFQRITPEYILVYSGEKIEEAGEITEALLGMLSDTDKEWLQDCNMLVLNEFEKEHSDTIQKANEDFLKELEANLKKEKEKLNGRE